MLGVDVELHQHLASSVERAEQQRHQLVHRVALGRVVVRRLVGDHLGVADQDRVDDPQPGGPQGPPGLGDVDDAVGDVGDLGLARAVGQPDVGLDALGGEEPPRSASGTHW